MLERTDPTLVTEVKVTEQPTYGQPATGYGGQIPTRYMVRYLGRLRRVFAMQYGNSGSLFIKVRGTDVFLDTDTEHALEALR